MRILPFLLLSAVVFPEGASAQPTMNESNFVCEIRAAKQCFDKQEQLPDSARGGQSRSDYCSDRAIRECDD